MRALWRETMGRPAPDAFSKDLIARALAYRLQEQSLGGVDQHLRRLLASLAKPGAEPIRHLKIGSVIVREFEGEIHEVTVAPGGLFGRDRLIAVCRLLLAGSRERAGTDPASLACVKRTSRRGSTPTLN